jgi:hypothetical protein
MIQPKDAWNAITSTDKIASYLLKWIAENRGFKRTVILEFMENIELIRLYIDNGVKPIEVIHRIDDSAFRKALAEGFNLNSIKHSKIGERSTKNIPQLKKYHGWDTQRVFENIYQKISTLKHIATIKRRKKSILLGIRLNNVFKLMLMLAIHIGN